MFDLPRTRSIPRADAARDSEYGEVKISLGIISGRIALSRSTFEKLRGLFKRTPLEQQVEIPRAEVFITVQAADHGTVDLYLQIVNLSATPLQVEQLQLDWFGVSSHSIATTAPQPLTVPRTIAPRSIGSAVYRVFLMPASVRDLQLAVRPASSLQSTPDAPTTVRGVLTVSHSGSRALLRFKIEVPSPTLQFRIAPAEIV